MWSTAVNRVVISTAIGLSSLATVHAYGAQPEAPTQVVARLYRDYGWQAFATQPELFGTALTKSGKVILEKYFMPCLAELLVNDAACQVRTREICRLDFDPMFDSQDPRVTDLEIAALEAGKVHVRFKDPVTDKVTEIDFALTTIAGSWRIDDVHYSAHPGLSLKHTLLP